jgi:energy-coupling factor transporter ATP-binding protein EcfA2
MTNPGELSPLDREIAVALRAKQPDYHFEPLDNYSELSDKTFVATIGPTGSGKSTLTDEVIRLAPEFKPNGTRTTRARRPADPDNFKTANEGITHRSMNEDIINQKLVNYSVFDTGHVYGTAPEDIAKYAIGPILSDSIDNLMNAGFRDFYPVFTVARGALYQRRLEQERLQFPDIRQRLVEAMGSLTFARLNVDAPWLSFIDTGSTPEELETAAKDVIRTVYQRTHPIMTIGHKLQLLDEMQNAVQNVARQLPLK